MATTTRTCLVTGASAGIGAAIAREYAQRGWDLALVARREEPMIELAQALRKEFGTTSHIFPTDLTVPGATDDLLARIAAKNVTIDGLVNNAGYGHPGHYLDSLWADHDAYIQLMLSVPSEMSYKFAKGMKERGFGRIIHVASLAGHVPGSKGHTLYAGIKSYLIKFAQSLNLELEPHGVHVTALCPGFTYSEFHDVNGTRGSVSQLPDMMWMEADEVAEQGVEACERNKAVFIPGRVNKSIALLCRLLPDSISETILRRNSEKFRNQNKY